MAHSFTRVTLVGPRKHADLLLPSDQPVGLLLPQVLNLLEDAPAEQVAAKVLVAGDGTELHADQSLNQARVLDGSSLLLCNAADAPPAAVVYDVTDLVSDEGSTVPGRWSSRFSDLTAGAFAAAGFWAAAEILLDILAPESVQWLLPVLSVLLLAAGAAAARPPRRAAPAFTVVCAGWLTGLGAALHVCDGDPRRLPAAALLLAGLTALALGALAAGSARPRALVSGAGTLVLAALLWSGAAAVAREQVQAGALAALAGTVLLGVLPRLALASSGLAALDDQRARGGSVPRTDARNAVAAAHEGLTLGTVIAGLCLGPGLWLLGTDTERSRWTLPLLLALTLAVFLRTRSFPLAAQRFALYFAAAVGLVSAVLAGLRLPAVPSWTVGAAVLGLAAAAGVFLTRSFPDHVQARFRLLAKRMETAAVLASVPLTAGMLGIFSQLSVSFS